MITVFVIWLGICVAALGWCIWGLSCNQKTYWQRKAILDAIAAATDRTIRNDLWDAWRLVEYEDHFKSVLWFRDPYRLYPAALLELINDRA